MKGIALAVAIMAAVSDGQDAKSVRWTSNYTEALNQTQDSTKPLLVVIDNPSEPELRADHARKKPSEKQAELLDSYELCRVDITTEHGKQVAEAFGVQQFPFMAIIDKTGAGVLYQNSGKMDTDEWGAKLAAYKAGEMPGTRTVSNTKVASKRTSTSRSRSTVQSACYT